jgi:hypothetical protein
MTMTGPADAEANGDGEDEGKKDAKKRAKKKKPKAGGTTVGEGEDEEKATASDPTAQVSHCDGFWVHVGDIVSFSRGAVGEAALIVVRKRAYPCDHGYLSIPLCFWPDGLRPTTVCDQGEQSAEGSGPDIAAVLKAKAKAKKKVRACTSNRLE